MKRIIPKVLVSLLLLLFLFTCIAPVYAASASARFEFAEVRNWQELQQACLNENVFVIYVQNDILLQDALTLNKTVYLRSDADSPVTLTAAAGKRHINISGEDIVLDFTDVVLDGTSVSGGIYSTAKNLSVTGALIQNCKATGVGYGGALHATGTLSVTHSVLQNNTAISGAAVYTYEQNTLILESDLINNSAINNGGGIASEGLLQIARSNVTKNHAGVNGGGIHVQGTLHLRDSIVNGNTSNSDGAGIFGSRTSLINVVGSTEVTENITPKYGGGIMGAGTIVLNEGLFSNNSAANGGAVYGNSTSSVYVYFVTLEDNSADRGGALHASGPMTISGATIRNNSSIYGGALYVVTAGNVTINSGTFTGNTASIGGGVAYSFGTIRMLGGTMSQNQANGGGALNSVGSIYISGGTITENTADYGGGIYNQKNGYVSITGGSIHNNTATISGDNIVNLGTIEQ